MSETTFLVMLPARVRREMFTPITDAAEIKKLLDYDAKAAQQAEQEGVSLNQYVSVTLAGATGYKRETIA